MSRPRIQIVYRNCPRCGRPTAGLNRSITGADAAHAQYAGICQKCITPEEEQDILRRQAGAILGRDRA